jgi:hypothetical protein
MTSISSYRVYRTKCCNDVFEEPIYASSNQNTVFCYIEKINCLCGEEYSKKQLEYVGIKRMRIDGFKSTGKDNIQIPEYMWKNKRS